MHNFKRSSLVSMCLLYYVLLQPPIGLNFLFWATISCLIYFLSGTIMFTARDSLTFFQNVLPCYHFTRIAGIFSSIFSVYIHPLVLRFRVWVKYFQYHYVQRDSLSLCLNSFFFFSIYSRECDFWYYYICTSVMVYIFFRALAKHTALFLW